MYTPENIAELLTKNNRAVERAILAIYNLQTEDEKRSEETKHHNGIGFSGADARLGTYYASWLNSGKKLSGQHLDRARKMALKYTKQLTKIANKEI